MTRPATPTPTAGDSTSTSTSITAGRLWAHSRGLLLALAVLIVAGVVLAVLRSGDQYGELDPRSADRYGSRALAELLADRGVTTKVVTSTEGALDALGPGATLIVTDPDLLTSRQRTLLSEAVTTSDVRTVLVAPGQGSTSTLAPGVRVAGPVGETPRSPDCEFAAATRAGDADVGGIRYAYDEPGADVCYLSDGLPSLLRVPGTDGRDTVLLGSPDILYNDSLAKRGNASLALQLLGSQPRLVWYLPSLGDSAASDGGDSSFFELIPPGWIWGGAQLAVAAALAALWRARRLGPLSTERMPVAVRASEATEGRARLYHRSNARDRAAEALRTATRARLARATGVPAAHAHRPEALCPAATAHLHAHAPGPARDVTLLLFGPVPADDTALVRLADALDDLEHRIASNAPASPSAIPSSTAGPATPPPPTERDSTS